MRVRARPFVSADVRVPFGTVMTSLERNYYCYRNFVKWNFTKFLITRDGIPYRRFGPKQSPLSFESDIQDVLAQRCETCELDDEFDAPVSNRSGHVL